MHTLDLESSDGVRLEAVVHPAVGPDHFGYVVTAHGMALDMDEGGMFMRLAERLSDVGVSVLRFSFRGHGGSEGSQRDVTIAGQTLDLRTAVDATRDHSGRLSIVAAGFGAVPTMLSLPYLGDRLRGLALWNPVLDLRRAFIEPDLPWGVANFGPGARRRLERDGFVLVDGEFKLGRPLFDEMIRRDPARFFLASGTPALLVQADRDTWISHDAARATAAERLCCRFHSVSSRSLVSWNSSQITRLYRAA